MKGYPILHEKLLQQQLSNTPRESNYDTIPIHIVTTLDEMSYGIGIKESLDTYSVKQKMVENINRLSPMDLDYLIQQMSILIDKSVNNHESIDENNVDKNFINFLIRLYY